MPDIKQVLSDEIRRLARKEVKQAVVPLLKIISEQKNELRELKKQLALLKKNVPEKTVAAPVVTAEADDNTKYRLNAAGIVRIRTKLDISQGKMAALLGVSTHTVSMWEIGRVSPRKNMKKAICMLRTLGRRELKKRLEALGFDDKNKKSE
ncbi:MAG: helix-turn-helix domain-containing protein [Lentisphaeria bacterium]|nr:helix-turn-helix domain-containing protein [Lentisphaeria bacterium]